MNSKDAHVIKILADLDLKESPPLSPEEEQLLQQALDPELDFLNQVETLFQNS